MEPQYNFIRDSVAQGKTILAYDRKAVPIRACHINARNFTKRVKLVERALVVDGIIALGWTLAVKP